MRWGRFVGLAFAVFAADQASKVLAVAHLTPGIADQVNGPVTDRRAQKAALDTVNIFDLFRHYWSTKRPCQGRFSLCPEVKVIGGFWSWHYTENDGAAFSILANLPESIRVLVLLSIPGFALLLLVLYVRKVDPSQRWHLFALGLVLGGGLGNLFDRARAGYVIDFIVWYRGTFAWPTFNVADVAISVGLGLLFVTSLADARTAKNVARVRADEYGGAR